MPSTNLPLVIVNPASRGGAGARDWPEAASALRAHFGPFACRFTEGPGDACRIAREEARCGRPLLVAFGGDGTISEVARGILASGAPCELGVLPHGTGADFPRSLDLPTRLGDAARALRLGRPVPIDTGRVVFEDETERSFVNAASFGLSAEVARRVNRANRKGARASYALELLRAVAAFHFPNVEFVVEDEPPSRVRLTTASIHNGPYFGGGMKMAPEARLTDGRLNLVVVRKIGLGKLLGNTPRLYWGLHLGLAEVEHRMTTSLEASPVDGRDDILVEADGELAGKLPARFEVRPGALRLRLARSR